MPRHLNCCEAFRILSEHGDSPEFYETQIARHDSLYEELLRRAAVHLGARVLDLGTGTGPVAIKLAQRIGPAGNVTGLDVNRRMITVAKKKARTLKLGNVRLAVMNMERLRFPSDSFDHVVSSYGVCCCFHYDRSLKEAFRVLKRGGMITFSQDGPRESPAQAAFDKIFSKHKTRRPSMVLKRKREAVALQERMTRKFRIIRPTLALMRSIGFRECRCDVSSYRLGFSGPEDYLNYMVIDSREYEEMTGEHRLQLRSQCISKLARFVGPKGLNALGETAYFSGLK